VDEEDSVVTSASEDVLKKLSEGFSAALEPEDVVPVSSEVSSLSDGTS